MNWLKDFCKDFPTLGGSAVTALALLIVTGLNVNVLMAREKALPDGYDAWFLLLGALATGSFAAMIGKRLSDFRYKQAGTSPVTVEAPSSVTVTPSATGTHPVQVTVPEPITPITPVTVVEAIEPHRESERGE